MEKEENHMETAITTIAVQIQRLKTETDAVILAHTYQPPEILALADITGDSFALAEAARSHPAKRVVMCGVRFMAETVKILSPEKEVILPAPSATCPMAQQISPERVRQFKAENPGVPVVVYINTTAALKAECDVCVTSSSAVNLVAALPEQRILFIPDCNLGAWVQQQLPEKELILWEGHCPIHAALTEQAVLDAKHVHPGAKLAMHPECPPDTLRHADMIGSTKAIIDYIKAQPAVIIGTERGVADSLTQKYPEKELYHLAPEILTCPDMKKIAPADVLGALAGECGEKMVMDEELRSKALRCIERMLGQSK